MMKRIIFILIIFLGAFNAKAQQTPMFSQYMFNDYLINPAVAGTHNYYQIRSNHRFQWVGLADAPLTNTLSMYGPMQNIDMGMGFAIMSDMIGPTSYTGFMGSAAYNMPINNEIKASGGISLGMLQYKVDGQKIEMKEEDYLFKNQVDAHFVPDANLGLYVYSSNFHVGFASYHLLNNKIKAFDQKSQLSKLKTHFVLHGGYKYFINREFAVEPTALLKVVSASPMQFDISARVIYRNMVWSGLSFRTGDALSILLGYTYENKIYIGYSYDFSVSSIRTVRTGGSHELMVGYKFNSIKD